MPAGPCAAINEEGVISWVIGVREQVEMNLLERTTDLLDGGGALVFRMWLRVQQWQGGSCLVMRGCMRALGNFAVVANSGYVSVKSPMLCAVIAPPKQRCRNLKRAAPSSLRLGAASWR